MTMLYVFESTTAGDHEVFKVIQEAGLLVRALPASGLTFPPPFLDVPEPSCVLIESEAVVGSTLYLRGILLKYFEAEVPVVLLLPAGSNFTEEDVQPGMPLHSLAMNSCATAIAIREFLPEVLSTIQDVDRIAPEVVAEQQAAERRENDRPRASIVLVDDYMRRFTWDGGPTATVEHLASDRENRTVEVPEWIADAPGGLPVVLALFADHFTKENI